MNDAMLTITAVPGVPGLWCLAGETRGYLLVRGERSLLIDCPAAEAAAVLQAAGLPAPEVVLHTQVQEEHCREWAAFPAADVHVFAGSREVALRSAQFIADCTTVWPPSREWDARGEELYGIAGCVTERPPLAPLRLAGLLTPGETFQWEDIVLEIVALPGSGKRAIGFFWREAGVLFSGDLLHAGGYLVNLYDLERSYGVPSGYTELRNSLAKAQALQPALTLPSTGPAITDLPGDVQRLQDRLAAFHGVPARRKGQNDSNYRPLREFGRYKEVLPGVYQNTNFGNMILFVDDAGHGLVIDPDFCVWEDWDENCRQFHADLDLLERETGLTRVEIALPTHYHGDHVQYCDVLRERYGTEILATPDVAAVIAQPGRFPYPCTIDWYGFPFDAIRIDRVIAYEQPLDWHGVAVTPIHTPGHCFAHAGFCLVWNGQRIACTGDTIQYNGGALGAGLPVLYNDTAWPDRGLLPTIDRLRELRPDWLLCGHSHAYRVVDQTMWDDYRAVQEEAQPLLAALLPDGDLLRGMTPPGYDAIRPSLTHEQYIKEETS